jgi:galactose mutarotase-like enzyme
MQNGIQLEVISNQIGIQLYTADFLNAIQTNCDGIQSCSQKYGKHAGFCLMPDTFPDALTHVSL